MLDSFLATLSPMLVMFFCILVGYLLKKARLEPDNTASVLSKLEIYVFLPAQILVTFLKYCTVETLQAQSRTLMYGGAYICLAVVLGLALAQFFSKERNERNIYRYSLVIANMGFLGNAIVPQIMGQDALYSYLLFTLPAQLVLYLWAIGLLVPQGKGEKKSLWQRLRQPTLITMVISVILGLTGAGKVLPSFVHTSLNNLSGCMGPVAMLLTGFVIGGYRLPALLRNKKVYLATFLRLFVLPCAAVAVMKLLGADKTTLLLTLFASGSALGLNTVVIPAAYDGDTHTGAAMAMISHVGVVVSIPLLFALLSQIL